MDECYLRLLHSKDVVDCIVIDLRGYPIKSSMNDSNTLEFIGLFGQLVDKVCKAITKCDTSDEMASLRIRTVKHEVLITPDDHFVFMVIQKPNTEINCNH